MTDLVAEPDTVVPDLGHAGDAPRFYVVGKKKFIVLYLATLGLYGFYWFYKQWSCYKDGSGYESEEHKIWPIARALFPMFFTHSLFREVKRFNQAVAALDEWESRAHATFLVIVITVSNVVDRLAGKSIGSPYTDLLSLALLAPLLFFYYKAQAMINISCGDPEGAANRNFTAANYAWIVVGGLCWLLTLVYLFVPDDSF